MDNFVTSAIIAIIFIVLKMLEAKFIKKEETSIKKVGRDGLFVYVASLIGLYVGEILTQEGSKSSAPGAYTNQPEF